MSINAKFLPHLAPQPAGRCLDTPPDSHSCTSHSRHDNSSHGALPSAKEAHSLRLWTNRTRRASFYWYSRKKYKTIVLRDHSLLLSKTNEIMFTVLWVCLPGGFACARLCLRYVALPMSSYPTRAVFPFPPTNYRSVFWSSIKMTLWAFKFELELK